jgi:3',5'-nucleoside bisphosphate phosphatase
LITELHCHTTASDGTLTPSELLALASQRDVKMLAVTDHDTVAAHPEAIEAGMQYGIRVIPGIEVSSLFGSTEVHVLGYGVEPADEITTQQLAQLRDARDGRALAMVNKLRTLGIPLSFERVKAIAGDSMVGRPHIAKALLEGNWVSSRQQAFDEYLAEGKPAFVAHQTLSPAQAVELIHRARGIAVLAHPALFAGNLDELLANLVAHHLDGVEAYYPMHSTEQSQHYAAYAKAHHLIVTGGSDFHGFVGDQEVVLGSIHLSDATLAAFDARLQSVR